MSEREYTVVYEPIAGGGWAAYAPDLPGLGVGADTVEETEKLIREGISIYIEEMTASGDPIPEPTSYAARVKVFA